MTMKKIYIIFALAVIALSASAQKHKTMRKADAATLPKPVVKLATDITANSFTANWEPVEGAEGYVATVYRKDVADADGEYTLVDEDFAGLTEGSIIEPAGGDEEYVDLSPFTSTPGWGAWAFPNFIPSMVAGKIYSPEIDLSHNDGKYKIIITTYSNDGDEILIESHGKGDTVKKTYTTHVEGGTSGMSTTEIEFDNGCEHLFFSVINITAEPGTADYFDRIQVVQELKKDDVVYTCVALNESIDAKTEWDEDVTSCKFYNVTRCAGDATTLYYDIFASAYNFGYDDQGKMTYNYVYSPYSDFVKVDLINKTSEIVDKNDNTSGNTGDDDDKPGDDNIDPDAPQVVDGMLTLGEWNGEQADDTAYDGFNTQNSPLIFTYRHSGSQTIYLPEQLKNIKDKQITSISFKCFAEAYVTSDYTSTMKLYIKEVDDEAFYYNPESEYYEWFDFNAEEPATTLDAVLDFQNATINYEDIEIKFDLSENPYTYTGKTLLLTIVNDADTYIDSNELVRFYMTKGKAGDAYRTSVFASDSNDFFWNVAQNHRIIAVENEYQWRDAPAVQFAVESPFVNNIGMTTVQNNDNAWYNLQGQRVEKPQHGIYIHAGKIVVLK